MIVRWLIGLSLGTLIIAATSPWFVRSYVPRQFDEVRHRVVLKPGELYRWRAEGYATTSVGPHGMMGRTNLPTDSSPVSVLALWGDSQAEGVSVSDSEKLWKQLESDLQGQASVDNGAGSFVHVLPFAGSGDQASAWRLQMRSVEDALDVSGHVVLLCEVVDLMGAEESFGESGEVDLLPNAAMNQITEWVPDFVVHAGRNLITDSQTLQRRRLRFSVGPTPKVQRATQVSGEEEAYRIASERAILDNLAWFREATTQPIWIVYAPRCPLIMDGKLRVDDPDEPLWDLISRNAAQYSIDVVDCRAVFRDSVERGEFPHGFHNGRFGNGHLNATGYRLISREFAKRWGGAEKLVRSDEVSGAAE